MWTPSQQEVRDTPWLRDARVALRGGIAQRHWKDDRPATPEFQRRRAKIQDLDQEIVANLFFPDINVGDFMGVFLVPTSESFVHLLTDEAIQHYATQGSKRAKLVVSIWWFA